MEEARGTDTDALLSELMQGLRLATELSADKYALIDIYDGYRCDESNQRLYICMSSVLLWSIIATVRLPRDPWR